MIAKAHNQDGKLILTICDDNLIDKIFEEDNKILDLTSNFYKGKEATENDLKPLLKKASAIHAIGEESINFLTKESLIKKENTQRIQNIPHAQSMSLNH